MNYKNIETVTAILKAEAKRYKRLYDEAANKKKESLEEAEKGFIGQQLTKEKERILQEFNNTVTDLRNSTLKSLIYLEELRDDERSKVQGIDKVTLDKINALRDIPISEDEFLAMLENEAISSNYWAKKSLMTIAEKNGIDVIKTGLGADLTTKMSVIDSLEKQMLNILSYYPDASDNPDPVGMSLKCKYVYLSGSVINNAVEIYGGKIHLRSQREKAENAYLHIKAAGGDISRAIAINNTLRNAKNEEMRNHLLSRICNDENIGKLTLELSGHYEEIIDFKRNKNSDYIKACLVLDEILEISDKDYLSLKVEQANDNEFFKKMYETEMKRNEHLRILMNPTIEEIQETTQTDLQTGLQVEQVG